jgi:hypothetical protein
MRAALQAQPAHETQSDVARAAVTLDDGDLEQVARGVGDGLSVSHADLVYQVSR